MKKVIKQWLAFSLVSGVLFSCSSDRNEPSSTAEGRGETVTLSLSAEVSVDDSDLRAINYKLGTNANGKLVPMPQFTDGQLVDVHTILKSSTGAVVAKTLKWRYNAASKSLVLSPMSKDASQDVNNIVISNFNNTGGVKWYVSGFLGGTLDASTRKVSFEGTRELRGVEGNVGDIVGSLNVPYAFGWTEVTINTQDKNNIREGNGSYRYAQIPSSAHVKFSPLGSLIAYKLGNDQREGAYTFTPSGFYVSSNVFFDKGTFDLNTAIPTSGNTQSVLPTWTEGSLSNLVYSFASGQEPGTIEHKQVSGKTYYAWVMPNSTKPAVAVTRVMMKGESSHEERGDFRNYTKTWFTDYSVKGTQLNHGRVYSLKANATHTYRLPIEYVTDYNLAGGEGLTHTTSYTVGDTGARSAYQVTPIGVKGPLRFANFDPDGTPNNYGHRNDASGYYTYFKLGYNDSGRGLFQTLNPDKRNLALEVDNLFGPGKYIVPSQEQWWGIFPYMREIIWNNVVQYYYPSQQALNQDEFMAFGPDDALIRQSYSSDYSKVFTSGTGHNDIGDGVVYAIRFKERKNKSPMTSRWNSFTPPKYQNDPLYTYPSASDNSLKCAYRFTRHKGMNHWFTGSSALGDLDTRYVIDVVYLGEEVNPTTIDAISNEQWWNDKKAEGLMITKIFPACGSLWPINSGSSPTTGVWESSHGSAASYLSRDFKNWDSSPWGVGGGVYTMHSTYGVGRYACSVRLFHNQ